MTSRYLTKLSALAQCELYSVSLRTVHILVTTVVTYRQEIINEWTVTCNTIL